jgi:hypothetical protein
MLIISILMAAKGLSNFLRQREYVTQFLVAERASRHNL